MKRLSLTILLLSITGINLLNAQTIETDRPDQTESSATVPKGAFQIETGLQIEHSDGFNQHKKNVSHPTTLFRLGLLNWFELRAVHEYNSKKINFQNTNHELKSTGMSDIEVGAKIQLLDKKEVNAQIAFMSHVALPTGSLNFAEEEYATVNRFLISHNFGSIDIGYNIGFDFVNEHSYQYTYTLALAYSIIEKFSLYVEPFGEIDQEGELKSSFDAGIAYLLNDKMQVDFAFGTGINHYMNYITVGFSVLISKEEDESN